MFYRVGYKNKIKYHKKVHIKHFVKYNTQRGVIMAWTKERISLLIDLWTSGKSASVVAKEIGSISRNAVIGKIHRLGIANRVSLKKTGQKSKEKNNNSDKNMSHKKMSKNANNHLNIINVGDNFNKQSSLKNKDILNKKQLSQRLSARRIIFSHNPDAPNDFKKLSLLELKEGTCRWPSGDPKTKDFHFCGCPTHNNSPYCEYHAKIAYTQIIKRDAKSEQKHLNKEMIIVDRKLLIQPDNLDDNLSLDIFSPKTNPSDNINFL